MQVRPRTKVSGNFCMEVGVGVGVGGGRPGWPSTSKLYKGGKKDGSALPLPIAIV